MKLPPNLHIIEKRPETLPEKVRAVLGAAHWFSDRGAWKRDEFLEQVNDAMDAAHGQAQAIDQHLTAMLILQIKIYVKCWAALENEGLVRSFNSRKTPGKSPYLAIAYKALGRAALLLSELGLSPNTRPPRRPTGKITELLAGAAALP